MNSIIRHRGPDDEGYAFFTSQGPICSGGMDTPTNAFTNYLRYRPSIKINEVRFRECNIAFGHRRLAIVDLSPMGHQPMSSSDGRYWIIYNGEVYNYLEIRYELTKLGHIFVTNSDTEVILAAYSQWGEDALHRFNGMWAFAIYDSQKQVVFLSRDRFGVKPIYYWVSPEGFLAIGSEIKQFSVLPGWQPRINAQRAYDYLAFGVTDHTDETLFADVYQLKPGHYVNLSIQHWQSRIHGGRLDTKAWYVLKPASFSGTFEDAADEFAEKFKDAVRLRLRADVPIGSCLSGGLDSSSIVCMMNKILRERGANALQKTFSACSDVKAYDERDWIDIVVRDTGLSAYYVTPSLTNLFRDVREITWHQDEPFGSTSIYAQWNVFLLAKNSNVKVMLDGQGSDEQLAGYHGFFGPYLASLFLQFRWISLIHEIEAMRSMHGYSYLRALKYMVNVFTPDCWNQHLRKLAGYSHTCPDWLDLDRMGVEPRDPLLAAGERRASLQSLSLAQLTSSHLQMLLHWEDRDSMAHSIESRVPFLDYRLVEFTIGLPDKYKLSSGITKRVLRNAMSGVLPDKIRDRHDKLGFLTPEEIWIKQSAQDEFRKRLEFAVDVTGGIINSKAKLRLEKIISGKQKFDFSIWRLINFGEWMSVFKIMA